jgi:Pyruvate/2-oxoacid:ferredoxin oxidoreductase delta subunit/flavodoxin
VAGAIAAGLRTAGYRETLWNLKEGPPPDAQGYDLLGVGSPVYYFRPAFNVLDYVRGLSDLGGRPAFSFLLHGTYPGDASNFVRRALARRGAREVGYFHCYGVDYFLGYLKQGYLFSPGHPAAEELAQAEAFGRQVAARVAGEAYHPPGADRSAGPVYRLERWVVSRWLVRNLYTRLFTVKRATCNACGLCMKLCPTRNIAADQEGRPVWGRECLACLTCELKCPREAITSPLSWPLMKPFMVYNVHRASRDPALSHVRVRHTNGRTEVV